MAQRSFPLTRAGWSARQALDRAHEHAIAVGESREHLHEVAHVVAQAGLHVALGEPCRRCPAPTPSWPPPSRRTAASGTAEHAGRPARTRIEPVA